VPFLCIETVTFKSTTLQIGKLILSSNILECRKYLQNTEIATICESGLDKDGWYTVQVNVLPLSALSTAWLKFDDIENRMLSIG